MDLWKISSEGHYIDPNTFSKVDFIITLPKPTLFDERIEFDFHYKVKQGVNSFKTAIVASSLTSDLGEIQRYNEGKQILTDSKKVCFSMGVHRVNGITKSVISFLLLCSDGQKCIVKYHFEKQELPPKFIGVERCLMNDEEKEYFISLMFEKTQNNKEDYYSYRDKSRYTVNINMLQKYVDALRKEITFLKNNGGKKHKVSNGKRLVMGKEGYCYQFELESELFLSEDVTLSIDTNTGIHAEGSVLVCEEFQIIVIVNKDLGEIIFKAEIGVEPWKLLVAQVERLSKLNTKEHPLAIKLIKEGPAKSTNKSIDNIPKGQECVKERVAKEDITVVWGPPGTGKTYTMSDIAIDFIQRGKTVLIVSHSNVSVDGVIKRVADKIRKIENNQLLTNGYVFRYGYIRDSELSKDDYVSSFNYAMNHCQELKAQLDVLLSEKEEIKSKRLLSGQKLVDIEKKLGYIRGKIREQERIYVSRAKLVGTTISKVIVDSLFEFEKYDLVMFDEVSMAYVTQLACAASFAKNKFVCVGDFMQLPPIAQDQTAKTILERDIFEYLGIVDNSDNLYYHPWLVMLDTQRRMHPDIADFINKHVYKNLLRNDANTVKNNKKIVDAEPLKGCALNMIDLFGTYSAASKNLDNSRFNILGAIISFSIGLSSESNDVKTVGIITPYAAQMRLIRAMIKDYKTNNKTSITCATVHQFQGSESDVIVFDAVESYPTSKAGFLMSKNIHSVKRLINVAITRAKGKMINIGNSKFWLKEFADKKTHIYYQFIVHLIEKHNVVSNQNRNLHKYLLSLNTGNNISFYLKQEDCLDKIKRDFDSAENQILVSIPDGNLKGDYDIILDLIRKAEQRGVQILMKSNTYADLPEKWKKYCVGTENAFFPLVMIDAKTIWYGIPLSKGKFQVRDYAFITVCDTLIRIKGESTIEMIISLSELMTKRIGNCVTQLQPKTCDRIGKTINGLSASENFPKWITEKQFCTNCRQHLTLAKGRTGKYYLRCSEKRCNHTEFLTKDMINNYIVMNNVVCPKDSGELQGKLGQFGVYITCGCGHTINPDQI